LVIASPNSHALLFPRLLERFGGGDCGDANSDMAFAPGTLAAAGAAIAGAPEMVIDRL